MKRNSRSITPTASLMLRSTSSATRRSRSARRLAVMSRAVPARRSGLPSASRSTTLPRERTQTQSPLASRTRCSDSKISAWPVMCSCSNCCTRGRSSGWTELLRHSSVLIVSSVPWPNNWLAPSRYRLLSRMFQSQNSSPEPHSARFRRASRSRIWPAGSASCSRRRWTRCQYQPAQRERGAAAPAGSVADARGTVPCTTHAAIPEPVSSASVGLRPPRHKPDVRRLARMGRNPSGGRAMTSDRTSRLRRDQRANCPAAAGHGRGRTARFAVRLPVRRRRGARARRLAGPGDGRARADAGRRATARSTACSPPPNNCWNRRILVSTCCCPTTTRRSCERGDALIGWCRGFLGGFGLSAGAEPPLSEESARRARRPGAHGRQRPGLRRPEEPTRKRWRKSPSSCASPRCCCTATACSRRAIGGRSTEDRLRDDQGRRIRPPPQAADAHGRRGRDPDPAGRARAHPQQGHAPTRTARTAISGT